MSCPTINSQEIANNVGLLSVWWLLLHSFPSHSTGLGILLIYSVRCWAHSTTIHTYVFMFIFIFTFISIYIYIYTYFIYIILSTYRPYISIHIYTYMIDHQIFISSIFSLTQPQGDVHDSLRPPPPQQPVAQSGRLGKNRGNFSVLPSGKLTVCYWKWP